MNVVLLAGGVGGAKMAEGLTANVGRELSIIVNTGDDLELHGLAVWPDHDTVAYTLAGLDDQVRGWGLRDESWTVMDRLETLGGLEWFRLGDQDLATHLWRTDRLRAGGRPTEVALELGAAMGIEPRILLMSDQPVRTEVLTEDGWLEFQEYFVHRHQEPTVRQVRFRGVEAAETTAEVLAAIAHADVIVIAPSNPIVSIDPILAVRGIRPALEEARARGVPMVAVSGIVGGKALKGPADRMLASLGHESSALGIARLLADVATDIVIDRQDAALADAVAATGQLFRGRGIVLETRIAVDAAEVAADRDRVMQVLINLLSNAAKFCHAGTGRVELVLWQTDGFFQVDVADNGPGVAADEQEYIFEKFRQAGDTLTAKPQGTGLGLPISRQIVDHFGGRLWLRSVPGAGATFSFTLPARFAAAPMPPARETARSVP